MLKRFLAQALGSVTVAFEMGVEHMVCLASMLCIHSCNGLIHFRIASYIMTNIDLPFFRHFWHNVVAVALDGPPERYRFIFVARPAVSDVES